MTLMVLEFLTHLPAAVKGIIMAAALLGAIAAIWKAVIKPVMKFTDRIDNGMDALLGYKAIVDPATGRELQAETPSMAVRVFKLEESQAQIADAITRMAALQESLGQLQTSMVDRDAKYDAWIAKHEAEAADRELRLHEWEQWRSEQTSMWELIRSQTVLKAVDDTEGA